MKYCHQFQLTITYTYSSCGHASKFRFQQCEYIFSSSFKHVPSYIWHQGLTEPLKVNMPLMGTIHYKPISTILCNKHSLQQSQQWQQWQFNYRPYIPNICTYIVAITSFMFTMRKKTTVQARVQYPIFKIYECLHKCTSCAFSTDSMKGTEVPNPWRSSTCDRTCVLTRTDPCTHCFVPAYEQFTPRFQTLSCLPCTFCLVPAYAKFAHEFLMLLHRPCATYFNLPSWFHSIWFYCSHHSAFRLDRRTW